MSTEASLVAVAQLSSSLRGPVVTPAHDTYDVHRRVYNAMIDKRPRAIARCTDVADVVTAVRFAREQGLVAAIRGGGHNGGGLGVCDDGLVIDLSAMKYVRVDARQRTVRVGGGTTWGDVDHATHPYGLAVPAGIISTTGVGGLTLGGGLGHLTRRYGLTVDNLLSADLVLADGSLVTASEDEHPDLFWALRGGGGNFGVVTSFLFRAHPVRTVFAGPMFWDLSDAPDVLRWYDGYMASAPDEVNGFFVFLTVPPGPPFPEPLHMKKVCGVVWCYTGGAEGLGAALAPARAVATPLLDMVGEMPFPALQSMFDPLLPPGLQWYWRADFFKSLNEDAIARHVEFARAMPTPLSTMHLYPVNGAASRVGPADTPWAHRDARYAEVIVGIDPDPANAPLITRWCKQYWEALHPYSTGAAYVNFMMDEGPDRVRATYGANYDRLLEVKHRYDPDNFFCVNQNVK